MPSFNLGSIKAKDIERQRLAEDIALFKGKIEVLPPSYHRGKRLLDMKAGLVDLIEYKDVAKRWNISHSSLNGLVHKYNQLMWVMVEGKRVFALQDVMEVESKPGFSKRLDQ